MNGSTRVSRKPSLISSSEDVDNLNKGQSKTRRLATNNLPGKFSKTSTHFVDQKRMSLASGNSKNELLLKSLLQKLKNTNMNKHLIYIIEKDIRHVLFHLHSSCIPRVKTWQDKDGLDIVHICIIADTTDLLETLLIQNIVPRSHQPMICPYAHLSVFLNRPECLQVVLTNRPDDHFNLVDSNSISGKLPQYVLNIATTVEREDRSLELRMTCLLASLYNYSKPTADEMNISVDVVKHCAQKEAIFNKNNKGRRGGTAFLGNNTPSIDKLDAEEPQRPTKRLTSPNSDSSITDVVYHSSDHLPKKEESIYLEKLLPEGEHLLTYNLTNPDELFGIGNHSPIEHRKNTELPTLQLSKDSIAASNVSLDSKQETSKRARQASLRNERNAKRGWKPLKTVVKVCTTNRNQNASDTNNSVWNTSTKSLENETPLSIAYKKGFFRCVKTIMDIIVAKQYGINKNSQLLTATTAESPLAIMALCENGADVRFDDFQNAVMLALRLNLPECCNVLLSTRRNEQFRKKLLGGYNLLHVMYTRSTADTSRGCTRGLNKMTCMLINNGVSVNGNKNEEEKVDILGREPKVDIFRREPMKQEEKPGQYPLYTLITCAFNDDSATDHSQYFDSFNTLLEAGACAIYKEKTDKKEEMNLDRSLFTSVFDCVFGSAQSSMFALDRPEMVMELLKQFCIEFYDHYADVRPFGSQSMILFSYMACAVKFDIDVDVLRVLLRLGFNPTHKHEGFYAVNYYFHLLFKYLETYEVENYVEFYKSEVENLMYLCNRMPLLVLKDAMLVFLDNQMSGIPIQAVFVAKYFCHLVGQIITSPRSLRDTCALQMWYHNCYRQRRLVDRLPVSIRIKRRIIP